MSSSRQRIAAVAVLIHFAWVLALSAMPTLHHHVHADADHEDHACAVTALTSGGCDLDLALPIAAPVILPVESVDAGPALRVAVAFSGAWKLEHAPPLGS